MRLLLAALFVPLGVYATVALLIGVVPEGCLAELVMAVVFVILLIVAGVVFNPVGARPFPAEVPEDVARRLEEEGLLTAEEYRATRAFRVEEHEDEGSHYFLELEDGGVLYLSGQYLYDYESDDEDAPADESQRFPCSEFTIRRHRDEGHVVDILCRGRVLKPEAVAPPFDIDEMTEDDMPEDGQIIRDRSYDEVKAKRLSGGQGPS